MKTKLFNHELTSKHCIITCFYNNKQIENGCCICCCLIESRRRVMEESDRDEDKGSLTFIDKNCAMHNNNNSTF